MSYLIYGKRTKPVKYGNDKIGGPDKTFRALTYQGVRVTKLSEAGEYATKEDAQEIVDKWSGNIPGVVLEIRKVK